MSPRGVSVLSIFGTNANMPLQANGSAFPPFPCLGSWQLQNKAILFKFEKFLREVHTCNFSKTEVMIFQNRTLQEYYKQKRNIIEINEVKRLGHVSPWEEQHLSVFIQCLSPKGLHLSVAWHAALAMTSSAIHRITWNPFNSNPIQQFSCEISSLLDENGPLLPTDCPWLLWCDRKEKIHGTSWDIPMILINYQFFARPSQKLSSWPAGHPAGASEVVGCATSRSTEESLTALLHLGLTWHGLLNLLGSNPGRKAAHTIARGIPAHHAVSVSHHISAFVFESYNHT